MKKLSFFFIRIKIKTPVKFFIRLPNNIKSKTSTLNFKSYCEDFNFEAISLNSILNRF